jgi:hypothetical protein
MPAFRSVMSVLVSFVRSFSTNSRPALRAAASGGRPRPAAQYMEDRLARCPAIVMNDIAPKSCHRFCQTNNDPVEQVGV